ncbi:MAG: hypothetical protein JWQ43_1452, partial [Glaciihabitans sp.]|nr:hypothetical protein [Glaciihabitans sp.]
MNSVLPTPAPRHSALERLVAILNTGPESAAIRDALSSFADGKEEYPDEAVEAVGASAATMSEMFAMDDVDSVATKLNEILNATSSGPRLSNHGGARWHVHVDRQPFDWASWFLSASALSMAVALSDHGRVVWGRCAR